MNNPFPNAETVSLADCCLKKNHSIFRKTVRLNELFPNARHLSIDYCDFKRKCVAIHFPQLNHLRIGSLPINCGNEAYYTPTYVEMLHLNPQLRSLSLANDYPPTLLWVASQQLRFLEHLELDRYGFEKFGGGVVNFPCLKKLKIAWKCDPQPLSPKIPISASSLKVFDSFEDHRTNQRLPANIIEALPLLEEIDMSLLKISMHDAIRLMNDYKSLKKLYCLMGNNVDLNHLETSATGAGMKYHLVCARVSDAWFAGRPSNRKCKLICTARTPNETGNSTI